MAENQAEMPRKHGGARRGAGRKRLDLNARWLSARGLNPLSAAEILSQVQDERKLWRRILTSEDDRVVLQAVMFLTSMRDGKPAQQINVTSTTITLKPEDIERARMIAREIRGEIRDADAIASRNLAPGGSEGKANIMLEAGDGGQLGGSGVGEGVESVPDNFSTD